MKKIFYLFSYTWACLFLALAGCNQQTVNFDEKRFSGAEWSLLQWSAFRAYPDEQVPVRKWAAAQAALRTSVQTRNTGAEWEGIGPKNIGGRTLSLAFHPTDTNVIYIGSAGGGLWKTETAGLGVQAWERVETGFPILGVPAIAINPQNPDEMYIGTGEVYNYDAAAPGIVNRVTRGTYGIGILKTTDGGQTWTKSLDWALDEMTGVQDIAIDPVNPATVFAATTEGLYRSEDAGESWEKIFPLEMAVDIEIDPVEPNRIYVSFGNFNSPGSGIYRSLDGGENFQLLTNGLPASYGGKTLLSIAPSDHLTLYASIADAFSGIGLYRSMDGGTSWTQMNDFNYATYQGWYSHDVGIRPDNPDWIVFAGVNTYLSIDGGVNHTEVGNWSLWTFGQVPVGGPEGPPNYVHADVHGIYFRPDNPNSVFLVTDGGVFYSGDAGLSWEGRNGNYQTQQFYANFSNSALTPDLAMGGMQDNATAIYLGDDAWVRVLGGDGMGTAIDPTDDNIMYGSAQFLYLLKSFDQGMNFDSFIRPPEADAEFKAFNSPFELAPQNPQTIYAGSTRLYRSEDGGLTWSATTASSIVGDQIPISKIGLSPADENLILLSLVDYYEFTSAYVRRSDDQGASWQTVSGLPDRIATDFAFSPDDANVAFAVFSGFGTPHVYKTEDGGMSWFASDAGLPDVPANTVLIDPFEPSHIYVGNDLGVYVSTDEGNSWEPYMDGLPAGVLAMDLTVSIPALKLRLATHGHGVYEGNLLSQTVGTAEPEEKENRFVIYPNPARDHFSLLWKGEEELSGKWVLRDVKGRVVAGEESVRLSPNAAHEAELTLPGGTYYLEWRDEKERKVRPLVIVR
ncbi:MAG TPA: hypothetical protein ENJ88_05730 [Phaeodactylibacter sp.]|nr:hypothetical protein [Phaeodactylibacter sp.]